MAYLPLDLILFPLLIGVTIYALTCDVAATSAGLVTEPELTGPRQTHATGTLLRELPAAETERRSLVKDRIMPNQVAQAFPVVDRPPEAARERPGNAPFPLSNTRDVAPSHRPPAK